MNDVYLDLVNRGWAKGLAGRLGLPRPVRLRRYERPGDDAPVGPVLVLHDATSRPAADALARTLLGWNLDVRRDPTEPPAQGRWGAVVLVVDAIATPADLGDVVLDLGSTLRALAPHGRIVAVSRSWAESTKPAVAAARRAVDGFVRSLAKELRFGATANGLLLADDIDVAAPSVVGAVRFFLSARSAYVNGQLLPIDSAAGRLPADWSRPLADMVVVITGAARGIGAATARVMARDGAQVVGVDVPGAGESLAAVMNEVRGTALQLDITAPDAAQRILDHADARYGHLDVVVHNAGILRDKLLANMRPEQWHDLMAVNLEAPLRMSAALAGQLGPTARILSLASTSGIAGNRGQTNYGAAKAGIIGMTRALASELARTGGTANAVAPGFIETDMTASIPPIGRQVARRASTLQQGGQPRDVGEALAFLASPQAGGINGQTLRVCGQNLVGQ
ncbi:MAG TPA: 3-oxoacyl-ACP reductase [Actinomycetaceae bacterium]|nr:3-oxoacyl-ACP reductase [Actinomycetaceae bacterium]